MEKVKLNYFILWCKNWYQPIDKKINIFTQAQKMLYLDGYIICNNPCSIPLNYIDNLINDKIIPPVSLMVWNKEITKYMHLYEISYHEALIHRIKDFFAYECDKLPLVPPTYSREIYKLGFAAPKWFGNSYKLANYKVKKLFYRLN